MSTISSVEYVASVGASRSTVSRQFDAEICAHKRVCIAHTAE